MRFHFARTSLCRHVCGRWTDWTSKLHGHSNDELPHRVAQRLGGSTCTVQRERRPLPCWRTEPLKVACGSTTFQNNMPSRSLKTYPATCARRLCNFKAMSHNSANAGRMQRVNVSCLQQRRRVNQWLETKISQSCPCKCGIGRDLRSTV